jgi:hypothetical protein
MKEVVDSAEGAETSLRQALAGLLSSEVLR